MLLIQQAGDHRVMQSGGEADVERRGVLRAVTLRSMLKTLEKM